MYVQSHIFVFILILLKTLAIVIFQMHHEGEGEKFCKKTEFDQNSAIKCSIQRIM
jgi:hypothetical protein